MVPYRDVISTQVTNSDSWVGMTRLLQLVGSHLNLVHRRSNSFNLSGQNARTQYFKRYLDPLK